MKVLFLSWKDRKHPYTGGAELITEELAKGLVADGHQVTFLVAGFPGGLSEEEVNGYRVIRLGNRWNVYWQVYKYYRKNFVGWADLVIDQINAVPFFAKFYVHEPNVIFIHQLCRKVWFYQLFFPLNLIGYLLEPFSLWLLRDRITITVSESTKRDLIKCGFDPDKIKIISEGIEINPVEDLNSVCKSKQPTILSLSMVREMKRVDHIIKAFELAKKEISNLELVIAGDNSGPCGQKVCELVKQSPFADSIRYLGKVDIVDKIKLMRESWILAATPVREGWGLTITEANSQGLPAVVYNIHGLRDSVRHGETGLICEKNNPYHLSQQILRILNNQSEYQKLRLNAWQWSKEINFLKSYNDFLAIINSLYE